MSLVIHDPSPREGGFTVIEVIIALLLLSAIAGGSIMAVQAANKLTQRAQTRSHISGVAESVYERMKSDRTWMKACRAPDRTCTNKPTTPTDSIAFVAMVEDLKSDGSLGLSAGTAERLEIIVSAKARDDEADGLGDDDKDGLLPDFYRVHIEVSMTEQGQSRLGTVKPVVLDTTLDTTSSGARGALVVQTCLAGNQIDERMTIVGCNSTGAASYEYLRMGNCPGSIECPGWSGVPVVNSPTARTKNVAIKPAVPGTNFNYRIVNTDTGWTRSSTSYATVIPGGPSTMLFRDVPEGEYTIEITKVPADWQVWESKSIPSTTVGGLIRATVESKRRSRAMVMFRRPDDGTFRVRFERTVRIFKWSTQTVTMPPISGSSGGDGYTISGSMTYLVRSGTDVPTRPGAAMTAWFKMHPLPYSRFTANGRFTPIWHARVKQWGQWAVFRKSKNVKTDGSGLLEDTNPSYIMPTGLQTREQLYYETVGPYAYWNGMNIGGALGSPANTVWINPDTMNYSPSNVTYRGTGECYSKVAGAGEKMQRNTCNPYKVFYGGSWRNPPSGRLLIGYSFTTSPSGGSSVGTGSVGRICESSCSNPTPPATTPTGAPVASQSVASHGA